MDRRLGVVAALLLLALGAGAGCNACTARRNLTIENLRLVEGQGGVDLPLAPHAGVNVGKSLYVTGRVNHHPDRAATHVALVVKLYRHGQSLKAKREYFLHDVGGLERIGPGAAAPFQVYLKETLRGYERVEAQSLGADFVP